MSEASLSGLVALLAADQQRRWQGGERVPAETYLENHPGLRKDAEKAVELIYREFLLREERGEAPGPEEYVHRFPAYAGRLRQQVELHRALKSEPTCFPAGEATAAPGARERPARAADRPDVPGYQVLEELGRGGMGVVYKAWQSRLNRVVALKMILHGDWARPDERARFQTEAEAIARLQHPHVVQVHEVNEHDGRPFLVLEFAAGGGLDRKLAGTPLPARPAARLMEKLARAVHHAHRQGIIHRDLKPANVLLLPPDETSGPLDTPKITDFGLAKLLRGGVGGQTPPGAVLGTPSYVAPEQASGNAHAVGPPADIYSLGAILYEALTGRPPFRSARAVETLQQVLTEEPVPPRRLVPQVSRDLETVCLKCLHKDPGKRYGTALDLADDLRRFLDGVPVRARPVAAWERAAKWARRRPAAAALVAVLAAAALSLSAGGWLYSTSLQAAARREATLRQSSEENFRLALTSIDRMLAELGPAERHGTPQTEPARAKLLREALHFLEQFVTERGDDPAVRAEVDRARSRLGDILAVLERQDEAERHCGGCAGR
jgi:serine/threonine protein kinase